MGFGGSSHYAGLAQTCQNAVRVCVLLVVWQTTVSIIFPNTGLSKPQRIKLILYFVLSVAVLVCFTSLEMCAVNDQCTMTHYSLLYDESQQTEISMSQMQCSCMYYGCQCVSPD